jgi:hypothetical protein
MDQAVLVGMDILTGSQIVAELERSGIPIEVALWMTTPEHEDGRVVLASAALGQPDLLKSYDRVAEILIAWLGQIPPPITILRLNDPFITRLRRLFANAKSVEGMRLGGQTIGNRFISEAYVYKMQ